MRTVSKGFRVTFCGVRGRAIGVRAVVPQSGRGQSLGEIEGNHLGSVVGGREANDFSMAHRRLGRKIAVRRDEVGDAHAFAVGVLAGMKNIAIEIDGLLTEGQDGRDADLVAILNLESFERCWLLVVSSLFPAAALRQIEPQQRAALMSDDALDFNVAQGAGIQHSAGQFERLREIRFVIQFIDRGTAHHAFDRQFARPEAAP